MSGSQLQIPATVRGLNGRGLSPTPPSDGQLLRYNASTQLWEPYTPGPVLGVTDGSDAEPGEVGEVIQWSSVANINMTTSVWVQVPGAQMTLTPGDWDITGQIYWFTTSTGASTGNAAYGALVISPETGQQNLYTVGHRANGVTGQVGLSLPARRVSTPSGVTVQIWGFGDGSGPYISAVSMRARRIR